MKQDFKVIFRKILEDSKLILDPIGKFKKTFLWTLKADLRDDVSLLFIFKDEIWWDIAFDSVSIYMKLKIIIMEKIWPVIASQSKN